MSLHVVPPVFDLAQCRSPAQTFGGFFGRARSKYTQHEIRTARSSQRHRRRRNAMAVYQMGSHGAQVKEIQQALKTKGYYRGPVDGDFGGGTQAAVVAFQRASRGGADGRVGPQTWRALFDTSAEIPQPQIHNEDLAARCL